MILITGASGYIGQKLLPLLPKERVLILTRSKNSELAKQYRTVLGDLADPHSLKDKFSQVTRVIHLASITHANNEKDYFKINLEGTKNLIDNLPTNLKQFVYASTTCAEPGAGGYGESKLAVEKIIKNKLSNYVILKIADVYGGAGEKSIEQLIKRCHKLPFFPMVGTGKYLMAPVHVDDVVFALAKSTCLRGKQELIIAGLEVTTLTDLVKFIRRQLGKNIFQFHIPVFFFELILKIISTLRLGKVYPDQVKRLVVPKNMDSSNTWKVLEHQPQNFNKWLIDQLN